MDAPSERCSRCNWWELLKEIRGEFEMRLLDMKFRERGFSQTNVAPLVSLLSRSMHHVCREHWEGKR